MTLTEIEVDKVWMDHVYSIRIRHAFITTLNNRNSVTTYSAMQPEMSYDFEPSTKFTQAIENLFLSCCCNLDVLCLLAFDFYR